MKSAFKSYAEACAFYLRYDRKHDTLSTHKVMESMNLSDRKRFISYLTGVFVLEFYSMKTNTELQTRNGNMAKRTENSKVTYGSTTDKGIGEWLGFVDVKLPKEARIQALEADDLTVMEELDDLLTGSYKVSMTWDKKTETFLVSISCYDSQSVNFKRTLTTRYTDGYNALKLALWKHAFFLEGKWVTDESKDVNLG